MEFQTYQNESGTTVKAYEVAEGESHRVVTVGGRKAVARRGDMVVQSDNANMVDIMPVGAFFDQFAKAFDEEEESDEESGEFDPSVHSVKEVRAYLNSAEPGEVNRVLDAETSGKNRAGVFAP